MATSSRQSALFGAQDWKRIYQTYREADFQSYDYETLRKSFIDYITQYYPETFNDYIESSEFVALLDVIAFMGQSLAFRNDLNARENFIDTAERRDSVIKLANLVSYTPKRNLTAQGLVKITAISTTENLVDINNTNLGNTTVIWNDPANANWQEQFNTIINATLINSQRVGKPGNSQSILGVKTDEYTMNIPTGQIPVVPFQTEVDGSNMSFELVSATSLNAEYLYELPPAPNSQFNMLYRNDILGYGSANTGFFFYFKQGSLQNVDFSFPEKIENNLQQINVSNINNVDTWLYQLNNNGTIQSRWNLVDNIFISTNLQNTSNRKIYSVISRANDQVSYVFGDGVFGEIPVGLFRAYVRSGNALTYTISPSEMNGITLSFNYISRINRIETVTITISLQSTVTNALQRENIAQIKERAPARYYTQNRMVNGEDYTNFPFTMFNSIIKSKAVNRSSIGVSRNLDLTDPTGKYSSINVLGNDGAMYTTDEKFYTTFSTENINIAVEFLNTSLPVLLSTPEVIQYYQYYFSRISGYYNVPASPTIDNKCYRKRITVSENTLSGYFYIIDINGKEVPIPAGPKYTTTNLKYISETAQLKFLAPAGKYFDSDNRLHPGTPSVVNGGKSFIWVSVNSLLGDGYNNGKGQLTDGRGPIVLSSFVPSGAFLDNTQGQFNYQTLTGQTGIIPSFDNTLSSELSRKLIDLIEARTTMFMLNYDNSLLSTEDRWSVSSAAPATVNSIVEFTYNPINATYTVAFKNKNYYFGSVKQVRFLYDSEKKVFDPKSGRILSDFVNVFKTNSNPGFNNNGNSTLALDYPLFITGQKIESDGYPNDYAVKVSTLNINTNTSYNPDFFTTIVGTGPKYVFFELTSNVNFNNYALLSNNEINYAYGTKNQIEAVKYEYQTNTVFYAYAENKFFKSITKMGSQPPIIEIVDVTSSYMVLTGRNSIDFQYRHNSSNTTRIDPGTTNIIDLYLVTQSYYSNFRNWLNDSTGSVLMPQKPSINELQQLYGQLENYKMISDSVILNSVTFKPLFGHKAEPALQGTIKVVKSINTTASDSQIRSSIVSALNSYFTIDKWDFGDTFYFSELSAYLHVELAGLISSVVIVSNNPNQSFGDLYEIRSTPNEIFINGATVNDVIVISALTPQNLQRQV